MIFIQTIKKHLSSSLLLFAALSCLISLFFILFPIPNNTHTQKILIQNPSIQQDAKPTQHVQAVQTQIMPTQIPTGIPSILPTSLPQTTPTFIPPTGVPQPTTITLTVTEPDGTSSNAVTFSVGENPCSILYDAKNQGKIRSVTIKTYGPPLNSDYVQELNGYQNNWTFTLNGVSEPTGCSNYSVKKGDSITWKFG